MLQFKILGTNKIIKINEMQDFIAKGGEASIYKFDQGVLKIYHDKTQMIPAGKFDELSVLNRNNIIKPNELVLDRNDDIVGFTMKDISKNTLPLRRLFNYGFWKENGLDENKITKIVEFMQETTEFIHKNDCLIVDYNDLNENIDIKDFCTVFYIDVNAYSTKNYKSCVIQPYYKDYHTNGYNQLTDWFSFGIVIFQLYTGIHPFRGNHPDYDNTKEDTLRRMEDNASAYDKGVKFNRNIRDLSIIPANYDKWLQEMFIYGKRLLPPGSAGLINFVQIKKKIEDNRFTITLIKEFVDNIIDYKSIYGKDIILLKDHIYIDDKIYDYSDNKINLVFDTALNCYNVEMRQDKLCLVNFDTNELIASNIQIEDFIIIDNEIYAKNLGNFYHIKLLKTPVKTLIRIKNSWNIMRYSSQFFEGILYQNILGKFWISVPFPSKNWVVNLNIKELNDLKVLNMKRIKNILFVVVEESNDIKKYMIKLDYDKYKIFDVKDNENLDFVVLDNGIVVNIEDTNVAIFDQRMEKDKINIINDDTIDMDRIVNKGMNVMFIKNNRLYNMTNKK